MCHESSWVTNPTLFVAMNVVTYVRLQHGDDELPFGPQSAGSGMQDGRRVQRLPGVRQEVRHELDFPSGDFEDSFYTAGVNPVRLNFTEAVWTQLWSSCR